MKEVWIVEWDGEFFNTTRVFSSETQAARYIIKTAEQLYTFCACQSICEGEYQYIDRRTYECVQSVTCKSYTVDAE